MELSLAVKGTKGVVDGGTDAGEGIDNHRVTENGGKLHVAGFRIQRKDDLDVRQLHVFLDQFRVTGIHAQQQNVDHILRQVAVDEQIVLIQIAGGYEVCVFQGAADFLLQFLGNRFGIQDSLRDFILFLVQLLIFFLDFLFKLVLFGEGEDRKEHQQGQEKGQNTFHGQNPPKKKIKNEE